MSTRKSVTMTATARRGGFGAALSAATIVLLSPAAGTASAQPAPPTGWWSMPPEKLLEQRVAVHSRARPDDADWIKATAEQQYGPKIEAYRLSVKAELVKLENEREELRKQGYRVSRQKWNEWFEANRKLYEPVAKVIEGYDKEVRDKFAAATPPPAGNPPVAAPVTPPPATPTAPAPTPATTPGIPPRPNPYGTNPYAAPATAPAPAPAAPPVTPATEWATAELVEAQLGNLPAMPEESALDTAFEAFLAKHPSLSDAGKESARARLAKTKERHTRTMERMADRITHLKEAVRIVRATPNSVRPADVSLIRDTWQETQGWLAREIKDLDEDLEKVVEKEKK